MLGFIGGSCLVASCGITHRTFDARSIEREIAGQVATRYSIPAPPVTCPSGVRDATGQTFVCQVTIDGQVLEVKGTVTKGGQFTPAPQQAIIVVSQTTDRLAQDIGTRFHTTAHVDCGSRTLLVVPVGQTFACTVTFPGQPPRPVTVKVVDLNGDFGYTVAPAPHT
jgi:hypothetical protein